jgi:CRP-like cAMP-binding protein
MLKEAGIFEVFNLQLRSQITYGMSHHTYSIDDPIVEEGTPGSRMYFISKGIAILVHKRTQTFIKEIEPDTCCGELAFFSEQPRRVTIRSKHFTEV